MASKAENPNVSARNLYTWPSSVLRTATKEWQFDILGHLRRMSMALVLFWANTIIFTHSVGAGCLWIVDNTFHISNSLRFFQLSPSQLVAHRVRQMWAGVNFKSLFHEANEKEEPVPYRIRWWQQANQRIPVAFHWFLSPPSPSPISGFHFWLLTAV